MISRILSKGEYEAFIACVKGEKFSRPLFAKAASKIRFGSGLTPVGLELGHKIPGTPKEWRAIPEWSLFIVDKHQIACKAAWLKYWEIMGPAVGVKENKLWQKEPYTDAS